MSGFDPSDLLPFYLDETDEQIAILNDALLRLEGDPADAASLQEAFRIAHSIKGSSKLLGFEQVTELTHHLESYFDLLRTGQRLLDRPSLNLSFACLDALRDFHKELREEGKGLRDLKGCVRDLIRHLESPPAQVESATDKFIEPALESALETPPPTELPETVQAETPDLGTAHAEVTISKAVSSPSMARVGLLIAFEPNLAWRDMKARLVISRLSGRVRVLETQPPAEQFETPGALESLLIWVAADAPVEDLRALADVDGVTSIEFLTSDAEPGLTNSTGVPRGEPPRDQTAGPVEPEARDAAAHRLADREPATEPETRVVKAKRARVLETLRVDVDRLDHLMNLAGELVINKARLGELTHRLGEIHQGVDLRLLSSETRDRLEIMQLALQNRDDARGASDRTMDRLTGHFRKLTDHVESVLGLLDELRQGQDAIREMTEAIDQLARIAEGIQKGVLDTRMVPIGPLFERFRRVVRDLSQESGKEVTLSLGGEATELDKRMVDELADPLIHMVRNAVDHGLERAEDRLSRGKPASGTVWLQAAHRGNSVVITVSDDGQGIDPERIRKKIVSLGLVSAMDASQLSPRQLVQYIWHPGLSTAERVTDISGRGVGMDIVKSRIEGLNGTVDVRTEPGRGTTFVIRLPLTLAILPSLLVRIYDEYYAIALDAVDEIVEVDPDSMDHVQGRPLLDLRGRMIDLVELNEIFRWGGRDHPSLAIAEEESAGHGRRQSTVVVVEGSERTFGLRVDGLVGIREVVLKSIERHYCSVPGLSGASILADGRVSLILDLDAVESLHEQRAQAYEHTVASRRASRVG